jgi:hypothetical protein
LNGGITALPSNKKYLFSQRNKRPLDMAGTYYPTATEVAERVTLTTSTNEKCAAYHSRIPLLVKVPYSFNANADELTPFCSGSSVIILQLHRQISLLSRRKIFPSFDANAQSSFAHYALDALRGY